MLKCVCAKFFTVERTEVWSVVPSFWRRSQGQCLILGLVLNSMSRMHYEDYTCPAALWKLSLCIDFNGKAWTKIFDSFLALTFLFPNQFLKFLRCRASVWKFFPKKLNLRNLDKNKNLLSSTYVRAWYGMEILVWNMEDARMEWKGRFQKWNGR